MKFDILNRFSGEVQISAEIDCAADTIPSVKLGLAVKWAIKEKKDLRSADLYGADLRSADLYGADLRSADLGSADLGSANLRSADLRSANLRSADLRSANLYGADLYGADLYGADLGEVASLWIGCGDNRHIKTIQAGDYVINYSDTLMQIGCQKHAIADWWSFDDARIASMDGKTALKFWRTWKPLLQEIIKASPAEPTGYVEKKDNAAAT